MKKVLWLVRVVLKICIFAVGLIVLLDYFGTIPWLIKVWGTSNFPVTSWSNSYYPMYSLTWFYIIAVWLILFVIDFFIWSISKRKHKGIKAFIKVTIMILVTSLAVSTVIWLQPLIEAINVGNVGSNFDFNMNFFSNINIYVVFVLFVLIVIDFVWECISFFLNSNKQKKETR